ncbi:SDR family NAD(P)-dependent oxidoreductase [Shewanella frigidimarina]|uniref:SDR family NAD(P)-dependent oxidoreductase n=1 Tax=Shewanella frigidimarina TaxID=56812 RepID=UPI003D79FEA1
MTTLFGAKSTADEVLAGTKLINKRYLVTGVSSGIGLETARSLVAHGATVIGAVRDIAKAELASGGIKTSALNGGGKFELVELDLGSLASVRACANYLLEQGEHFDGIIANAGVMATPFGKTDDGFETQFGINYVGHFALINMLMPPVIACMLRPSSCMILRSASSSTWVASPAQAGN